MFQKLPPLASSGMFPEPIDRCCLSPRHRGLHKRRAEIDRDGRRRSITPMVEPAKMTLSRRLCTRGSGDSMITPHSGTGGAVCDHCPRLSAGTPSRWRTDASSVSVWDRPWMGQAAGVFTCGVHARSSATKGWAWPTAWGTGEVPRVLLTHLAPWAGVGVGRIWRIGHGRRLL